jgi:hypothetical protein
MTLAIGGAITIVGAILFGLRLPSLRGEGRQLIIAQQAMPGEPGNNTTATGAEA